MLRRMILSLVAAALVVAALCPASQARTTRTSYYYMLTEANGAQSVTTMTSRDARDKEKAYREEYDEAVKAYVEARKEWYKAVGKKAYPVPKPERGKVKKLGSIPSGENSRERADERNERRLTIYAICVIVDTTGEKSAEMLRRDQKQGKQIELLKAYADEFKDWRSGHETEEAAKKDAKNAPKKPAVVIFPGKSSIRDVEKYEKFVEKMNEKFEKDREKKAEKEAAKEAAKDAAKAE